MSKIHIIFSTDCNALRIYADEEAPDSSNAESYPLSAVPKADRLLHGVPQKAGWTTKRLKAIARQVWDIDSAIESGRVQFHFLKAGEGYRLIEPVEQF